MAIQSNSAFQDSCLGKRALYVRKLILLLFHKRLIQEMSFKALNLKVGGVCVCVCVCVCRQVRELVIDAGRDIMRNLELCVHRCFVYMWVEENALSCVL